jgi:hypothetical protein
VKRIISTGIVCIVVLLLGAGVFAASSTPIATPKATVTPSVKTTPSATPTMSPSVAPSKSANPSPVVSPSASVAVSPSSDNKSVNITEDSSILSVEQSEEIKKDNIYFGKWNGRYFIDFPHDIVDDVKAFLAGPLSAEPTEVLTNLLFLVQKTSVELVIKLVSMAFDDKVSFTWLFEGLLTKIIPGMYSSTFQMVISVIIAGIGFYIAFQLFKQDKNKVISIIVKTVLLVALANYFYTQPVEVMKNVDDATNEISKQIMSGAYVESDDPAQSDYVDGSGVPIKVRNAINADKVPMKNVATAIYKEYVHKPWQVLEFGSTKIAEEKIDGEKETNEQRILNAEKPKERNAEYKKIQEEYKFTATGTKKLAFMIVYMIPVMVNIIVLAFLALLVLAYKFLVVFILFLGIFIIPLSFVPSIGTDALKSWLMKLFGLSCMKIVLAFLLVIVLSFNNVIYSKANDWGWIATLVLQSVVYIVVFAKRNEIKNLFSRIKKTMADPASAKYNMGGYFKRIGREFDPVKDTKRTFKDAKNLASAGTKKATGGIRKAKNFKNKLGDIGIKVGESGAFGAKGKAAAKMMKAKKMMDESTQEKKEKKKQGKSGGNGTGGTKTNKSGSGGTVNQRETYEDMQERKKLEKGSFRESESANEVMNNPNWSKFVNKKVINNTKDSNESKLREKEQKSNDSKK